MKKENTTTRAFEKKMYNLLLIIGNNLHSLRMDRNAALKTVAKAIKISPGRLNKIEKGLCPHCKFGTLAILCKYYEVKLTDIVTKGKYTLRKRKHITTNILPPRLRTRSPEDLR